MSVNERINDMIYRPHEVCENAKNEQGGIVGVVERLFDDVLKSKGIMRHIFEDTGLEEYILKPEKDISLEDESAVGKVKPNNNVNYDCDIVFEKSHVLKSDDVHQVT